MQWISLLFGTFLAAQGSLRLVDCAPKPPLAPGPTYAVSCNAALAAAKEKKQFVLLYFTATW